MRFPAPLLEARLIRRYKRFLADVALPDGTEATAHVANPGAMLGLAEPGARVWLSTSTNAKRKLPYSWEIVEATPMRGGKPRLVGVNTATPNRLVAEALAAGALAPFRAYPEVRPEVAYGTRSRVDFLLTGEGLPPLYLEVKNCHLVREDGLAEFPDCKAARSARHLDELASMVREGARAALVTIVQMEAERFTPAADIDPVYASAFVRAREAGVETHAFVCRVTPEEIVVEREIAIV
ncbi:DNA/RNA nuclease SfsA [Salinarimonas ramus]|uniref:Sugar fermentation stimulation protein homolog n=1 Tax=Salinarimonas ramus TaxID=690164 RepID=A0A917QG73_9HYPH|nr:DNA/RNA nuclease SfsA [Salinarimonas ramus]GGK49308.1 sugar fermentation stimulation protein [Salinarimonas ramus]